MNKTQFLTFFVLLLLLNSLPTRAYSITGVYQDKNSADQSFSKFEGKILLVEAFATSCSHCQNEHKELVKVWDSYNGTINLLSLSVSSDDSIEKIIDYIDKYPTSWEIGLDTNFAFRDNYGIQAFPSLLLFTENGEIASCHVGERSFNDLSADIDDLITDGSNYIAKSDKSCKLDQLTQFLQSPLFFFLFLISLTLITYSIIKRIKK